MDSNRVKPKVVSLEHYRYRKNQEDFYRERLLNLLNDIMNLELKSQDTGHNGLNPIFSSKEEAHPYFNGHSDKIKLFEEDKEDETIEID